MAVSEGDRSGQYSGHHHAGGALLGSNVTFSSHRSRRVAGCRWLLFFFKHGSVTAIPRGSMINNKHTAGRTGEKPFGNIWFYFFFFSNCKGQNCTYGWAKKERNKQTEKKQRQQWLLGISEINPTQHGLLWDKVFLWFHKWKVGAAAEQKQINRKLLLFRQRRTNT